ncbi:hypothetical protein LVJ94_47055 [Pendulispora rubella]|uniref:Outer membrane protein beta-barrel domain-containing protein n=1 Tax=Pendulispora rubella TaxID=2741070 RepID=A0ABZ2L291_9BACT
MRTAFTLASSVAAIAWSCSAFEGRAHAAPQVSVGTTVGAAVTDLRLEDGPHGAFHLGAKGDVFFLRSSERSIGVGPFAEVLTAGFDTLEAGGGLSVLLPVFSSVPVILSGGAFARRAPALDWEGGLSTTLFFGAMGYNFHSSYEMQNGLFVSARYGLGDGRQADIVFGVRLDLMLFALPAIFIYEAIAH